MSASGQMIASYLSYDSLKIMHIFGIVLFLGNIIITGWWKTMADRTGEHRVIAFAQRQVTVTDWVFTFGGVCLLLPSALGMVYHLNDNVMQEINSQSWLWWGYYLFLASGVIWVLILIPVQIVQARMAREFAVSGKIPPRYWLYGKIWLVFGILATVLPLGNLYWMVIKS